MTGTRQHQATRRTGRRMTSIRSRSPARGDRIRATTCRPCL